MKEIFLTQNPWQNGKEWSLEGLISRRLQAKVWDWIDEDDALIICGPRQCGKTTLLKQLINDLIIKQGVAKSNIFYFSFNDYNLRRAVLQDPSAIFHLIDQRKDSQQRTYIFFDEIERAPLSEKLLKQYASLSSYKFVMTSSSELKAEELFSRKLNFHLYPFTFREFMQLRYPGQEILSSELNTEISEEVEEFFRSYANLERLRGLFEALKPYLQGLNQALAEYLLIGGLPDVLREGLPQALTRLKGINQLYLEKDIMERLRVEKHFALSSLLDLAAEQIGQMIRLDFLCEKLKVSFPTLKNFMSILEETYMIEFLDPFAENQKKGVRKTKKPYFLDLGLRNICANLDRLPSDITPLVENLTFSLLKKFNSYLLDDFCELLFFRTYDGAEVDFLLKARELILPVEVKYRGLMRPKIPIGLQNFMKVNDIPTSVVVTDNLLSIERFASGEVYFLPLTLMLFMV